ncbi:hypothetical protein [Pedobacter sp. GR22-6]|uniref:hypothetical protein n=1 Tax=Pedobacter sp. GR22-6 TaxID=3127957 RepID=UPI00307DD956
MKIDWTLWPEKRWILSPKSPVWLYDEVKKEHVLIVVLMAILIFLSVLLPDPEETASYLLKQMIPLVLIALSVFILVLGLAFWLVQRFWEAMGLPELGEMVLQFNGMRLWLQLGFYFACFALVLATGVGVLMAVL